MADETEQPDLWRYDLHLALHIPDWRIVDRDAFRAECTDQLNQRIDEAFLHFDRSAARLAAAKDG